MKVLITGATGFVGNYTVMELLKYKEHEIIATGFEPNQDVKDFPWFNNVKYISHDLNEEKDNYYSFFGKPDILIHLSWEGLPNFKELYHFERNTINNYNFIKNMVINGLKDINIIGTCFEYGMQSGSLSEDIPSRPVNAYALGKNTLREYIEELNKNYEFDFKWIRLFYMYGKGQNPKSILPLLDKALDNNEEVFNMSGGEQLRDYLRISKVAENIVKISLQRKVIGIINNCKKHFCHYSTAFNLTDICV
ncbi:hypothetical protein LCGC14_1481840 [marine sediment metagenome]|uniref:NAD-dependent epimerase/dehydratase domain-containing protein n=1 Tax=marine sediment metagenome TaxID=412755 RepID=A0A0F9LPU7_9ZZZZ